MKIPGNGGVKQRTILGSGETLPPRVLVFLHLPKTAGSTLARIIERQYNSSKILTLYDSFFGEEIKNLTPGKLEGLSAVMGHFYFGVHRFSSRPCTYVTVLRDPLDRVISHYYYVRRDPEHYLHPLALEMSLSEYVIECGLAEPNNDQTRLLAGMDGMDRFGLWSPKMLPVAKRNLQAYFAVVGLTEEFNRSLILMKRAFGWRTPYYQRHNISRNRRSKDEVSPETLRLIREFNELDCALYVYAKELLHEKVCLQGDSFERELQTFERLNQFYGLFHRVIGSASKTRWVR